MKPIDKLFQSAVDLEAEKLMKLTPSDIVKKNDYGIIETSINGKLISIGWWHYRFDNELHHIHYKTNRRVFIFLNKSYISGVKLENGLIVGLSAEELGNYD